MFCSKTNKSHFKRLLVIKEVYIDVKTNEIEDRIVFPGVWIVITILFLPYWKGCQTEQKLSVWQTTVKDTSNAEKQPKIRANTCSWRKARENACGQVTRFLGHSRRSKANVNLIWLYQLSWKCKLATVTSWKADVSSVSPSWETLFTPTDAAPQFL